MKKTAYLIAFLAIFLIQSVIVNAFYNDVPESHRYYDAVKTLYEVDLLPKYDNNKFNPDSNVTIKDLYELILVNGNVEISENINLPFTDIENSNPYSKYIQTALDIGFIKAIGSNPQIHPDLTIAKHYALSKIFKAYGIGTTFFFPHEQFPFIDIKTNTETAAIAMKAAELGIFEDENPEMFRMGKRVTKAEFAHYLYLINQYKPAGTVNIEFIKLQNSVEKKLMENEKFTILLDVWQNIHDLYYYINDIDNDELIYGAIKGLVSELEDPYTSFHTPEEADNFFDTLSNEYEGIGVMIELIDEKITIISPFKGSPAEKMGLQVNDIILKVNGEDINGKSLFNVASKIKGEQGTEVTITILRKDKELEYTLTRDFIIQETVKLDIINENGKNIAYIDIISFGDKSYQEFLTFANQVVEKNYDGIILNLRNNPGGFLDQAIDIFSLFTDEIKPVTTMVFSDNSTKTFNSDGNGMLKDYKIVVLINEGSASASEILAGAIQDYNMGKIIGTQSFGKGTVQNLAEYYNGALFKYTISKWQTPNENKIDDVGITPDKIIENTESEDIQLNAAIMEF